MLNFELQLQQLWQYKTFQYLVVQKVKFLAMVCVFLKGIKNFFRNFF